MSFEKDLALFQAKLQRRIGLVHKEVSNEMRKSVVRGSEITGAPGQPVQTGNLAGSWNLLFPEPLLSELLTNVVYAPAIEEGEGPKGPLTLRSKVGGFHSVKKTRSAFQLLVNHVMKKVV